MEIRQQRGAPRANQEVNSDNRRLTGQASPPTLGTILNAYGKKSVSEEELFAAVMQERISTLHGTAESKEFAKAFKAVKKGLEKHGDVSYEAATVDALRKMVKSKTFTGGEVRELRHQAFNAAQLDTNLAKLFDGHSSGKNDKTIAIASVGRAKRAAEKYLAEDGTGTEPSVTRKA